MPAHILCGSAGTRPDGAPRLRHHFRGIVTSVFFDPMCRDDTDAFAFKPNWIVRFLSHKFQKVFVARRRHMKVDILLSERTADHHIDEVFRQLPERLDLSFKGLPRLRWFTENRKWRMSRTERSRGPSPKFRFSDPSHPRDSAGVPPGDARILVDRSAEQPASQTAAA